jgi:hypothetical protein
MDLIWGLDLQKFRDGLDLGNLIFPGGFSRKDARLKSGSNYFPDFAGGSRAKLPPYLLPRDTGRTQEGAAAALMAGGGASNSGDEGYARDQELEEEDERKHVYVLTDAGNGRGGRNRSQHRRSLLPARFGLQGRRRWRLQLAGRRLRRRGSAGGAA